MRDLVDVVAQAIHSFAKGTVEDFVDGVIDAWDVMPETGREYYRRMAQAAIDSLQLVEQTAPGFINGDGLIVHHTHIEPLTQGPWEQIQAARFSTTWGVKP